MKLYKSIIFNFSILFLGVFTVSSAQGINFSETSVSNLKKGSKATNKPYFIYLFDENCADCKQVENLTFTDLAVSEVVNNRLLAGKVDLSSEEGQKLMSKNKIALAPAFLFYNQKGKLLLQQESSLSSGDMLKLLRVLYEIDIDLAAAQLSTDRFNNFEEYQVSATEELSNKNESSIEGVMITTERKLTTPIVEKTYSIKAAKVPELSEGILSDAKNNNLKNPQQLFDPNYLVEPIIVEISNQEGRNTVIDSRSPNNQLVKPNTAKTQLINSEIVTKTVIHTAEKLTFISVEPVKKSSSKVSNRNNKSIQFAAYNNYDDVLKGMYKMKRKIDSPLTIIEEYSKGKLMYKLILDDQLTKAKANELQSTYQQKGIDCFVRKHPN